MTDPTLDGRITARFQEKREAILTAAVRLFNARGVKGVTLAEIARSVGLATNSVTYYFPKKEELAIVCFLRSIEVYEGLLAEAAKEAGAAARVTSFFKLQSQLLLEISARKHSPVMYFSDLRALPAAQSGEVFSRYNDLFRSVRRLFEAPEAAALSKSELNARTHLTLTLAYEVRSVIAPRYALDQYARIAERVVDIMINGIAGGGSRWRHNASRQRWALDPEATDPASARFLRAATVLVNEQGYRGASVEKISARLNVTKGSFYHHLANKDGLIASCFERSFKVLDRALNLAEVEPGSGWDRVCAATLELARFQLSDEGPLLHASAVSALPELARRKAVQTLNRLTDRATALIVDGMMEGSVRPLDPLIAAHVVFGGINVASDLTRWVPGASADAVGELYVRPLLTGIVPLRKSR